MENEINEESILGGGDVAVDPTDPMTTEAAPAPQPVEQAQPEQPTATEPALPATTDQTEIGRAFAAQREALEKKYQAEIELARRQARENLLRELQQQQAQAQAPQLPEMPDPTLEPEAFEAWLAERDRQHLSQIESAARQQMQSVAVQTSLRMAEMTANLQKDVLGFDWAGAVEKAQAEIQAIAPLFGVQPDAYISQILNSPNAGERIMQLAQANAARTAATAPVDMAAVEKAAYEKAFKDLQAKSTASPHSKAPLGLPPGVPVAPVAAMTEDEILAQ